MQFSGFSCLHLVTFCSFVLATVNLGVLEPLLAGEDQVCNPSGLSFRYSGVRIYQTILYDWPVRHFWYVARCKSGKIASHEYFPVDRNDNFPFAIPTSISNDESYIVARRKKYHMRDAPFYRPYNRVGGIYSYNSTSSAVSPIGPLLADNPAQGFSQQLSLGRSMKYLPIFFTSESEPQRHWEEKLEVNPTENYTYSDRDRHSIWYMTNVFVNNINDALAASADKVVFWEFDSLQNQLNHVDWRRVMNHLVPDV